MTASWTTDSSLLCKVAAGSQTSSVGVIVGAITKKYSQNDETFEIPSRTGTAINLFSYTSSTSSLGTSISPQNAPATGGVSIVLTGGDFFLSDPTPTMGLSPLDCSTTTWTSWTAVACQAPRTTHALLTSVKVNVSTLDAPWSGVEFSYDAPVVTGLSDVRPPCCYSSVLALVCV